MSADLCHREDEVLQGLERGLIGPELDAHVRSCASCRELRTLAGALLDDRAQAFVDAPVPAAGTMWWRMRVRQRHEAVATARRSLLVGQALTLAIAIVLVASLFGSELVSGLRHLMATIELSTPLLLAVVATILLTPIAGWVAIRQK